MLARIWEQNRRFILIGGSGFALFLLLNSCIASYARRLEGPSGLFAQSSKLEREVRSLHKDLNQRYWEEKGRLEGFQKQEAALRFELELPREKDLEKPEQAATLVPFNQAIDKVWAEAREKANRASVVISEKLGSQDFDLDRQSGRREYESAYGYLGIARRALGALIDAGMSEIGRPKLVPEELLPVIEGNESVSCLLRTISFPVTGTYGSFVKTFKSLQAPQNFLQVRLVKLGPKAAGDERLLKGELEFVGISLVEAGAEPAEPVEKKVEHKPVGRRRVRR